MNKPEVGNSPARDILAGFRDPDLIHRQVREIQQLESRLRESRPELSAENPLRIMEVCGTHTVAIARAGLRSLLPPGIRLLSGPGCPVCVTANADIDRIIACTHLPNVTLCTFGDMIRVPGSSTSLARRKAEGASVEVVYSPLDALALAARMPERQLIFVGVGFETTTPLVAATIQRAAARDLRNFSVLAAQKQVPPAIRVLLDDPQVALDALLLPGHVSTIIGTEPYGFIASEYNIPAVITGFEPADILQGIANLLRQLLGAAKSPGSGAVFEIGNAYKRGVRPEGNPEARAAINEVFQSCDASWRGLGDIAASGYRIRETYANYDASARFNLSVEPTRETPGCRCGDVLRGLITANQCPLFARACKPENPIGPCMVSSEGSCAAKYRYG